MVYQIKRTMAKQTIQKILNHGVVHYNKNKTQSAICDVTLTYKEQEDKNVNKRNDKEDQIAKDGHGSKLNVQKLQDLRRSSIIHFKLQ